MRVSRCSLSHIQVRAGAGIVRGFTLVELMVTIAVAAILLAIAVPSFRSITLSNRLTTTANDIVSAVNAARMSAVKSNADTQVCGNVSADNISSAGDTLGTECKSQTAAVYLLAGGNTTQVQAPISSITGTIQLDGDMTPVRFGGQGLGHAVGGTAAFSGTIADVCTPDLSSNNHRVITMVSGSVIETKTTSGDCK